MLQADQWSLAHPYVMYSVPAVPGAGTVAYYYGGPVIKALNTTALAQGITKQLTTAWQQEKTRFNNGASDYRYVHASQEATAWTKGMSPFHGIRSAWTHERPNQADVERHQTLHKCAWALTTVVLLIPALLHGWGYLLGFGEQARSPLVYFLTGVTTMGLLLLLKKGTG